MACVSPLIDCTTCKTLDSDQKPKPGILLCIGCQKQFCSKHMTQHRQYLTDFLENRVVNGRNALQEKLKTNDEQQWSSNIRIQLETINKWELDTIEVIKQSATNARKRLQDMALEEGDKLYKQFARLSDELNTLRENENCLESDIDELTNKFKQLEDDVEHFPIERSIDEISNELISVKSIVQPASSMAPITCFVDQLLTSNKPNISVDISAIKPGRVYPISDKMITFCSGHTLLSLNISNMSWKNLVSIDDAIELHWFDHLQVFLVLTSGDGWNNSNQLYQFGPNSKRLKEVLRKPADWDDDFTTLTCYKQHILIVLKNTTEKWTADDTEWHTSKRPTTTWYPPISCQLDDKITCMRMNDRYYAFILEKVRKQQSTSADEFYFELRNRGMSRLHRIKTDYDDLPHKMRLLSLPGASGWLFFFREKDKKYCYVLNNNAERYDQNVVLSSNVIDITVHNNSIFLRKEEKCNNIDVLEIYDWKK